MWSRGTGKGCGQKQHVISRSFYTIKKVYFLNSDFKASLFSQVSVVKYYFVVKLSVRDGGYYIGSWRRRESISDYYVLQFRTGNMISLYAV